MSELTAKSILEVRRKCLLNLVAFRHILLQNGEDEVTPPDFHYEWSDSLLNGLENEAIEAFRESGKALALDTKIPTPKGFTTLGNLRIGDKVFDEKGNICKVVSVSKIFYGHDCYKILLKDGTQVIADAQHYWKVKNKHARKYQILTTEQILKKGLFVGNTRKDGYKEYAFALDVAGALRLRDKAFKIDPYLLGLWLGDGSSNGCDITVGDDNFIEILKLVTEKWGKISIYHYAPKKSRRIALIGGFRVLLKKEKLLNNKHIPRKYLRGSIKQREELLRGIVDTDGTIVKNGSKRGTISITTIKERLKDDYMELISSLGIKATWVKKVSKIHGHIIGFHYEISFKTNREICKLKYKKMRQSFQYRRSMQRSIIKIKKVKSVPTKCIAVSSKSRLFLITDKFIPTHNSQIVIRSFPLYCLTFPSRKRAYIVLLKKNATLASNKLKQIEEEYLTNEIAKSNLVKIHQQSGDVFSVDVKANDGQVINVRIEAYGKGASIRGLANKDRRPDICLADDLQDVDDAKSQLIMENDWNWFLSNVLFLGQNTRIFLIGNNLGERCIIERILSMKGKLERVKFNTHKIPILTETGGSAWPDKVSLEDIEAEKEDFRKLGKVDVWLREKMCQAIGDENKTFDTGDYRYYPHTTMTKILAECNRFGVLDPASSPDISSCYRAIVVVGVDSDNTWFVADVPYGRWDPTTMIDEIFGAVQKYDLRDFGVEKGIFKQLLEPFIYAEMAKRNIFFNIIPIEHAKRGSKLERIKMLQPRFKAHKIWFPESAPWLAELQAELAGVTKDAIKSMYIDLVDALAMVQQIAKAPGKKKIFGARVKMPEPVPEARLI